MNSTNSSAQWRNGILLVDAKMGCQRTFLADGILEIDIFECQLALDLVGTCAAFILSKINNIITNTSSKKKRSLLERSANT
jgi:hypothetical protein